MANPKDELRGNQKYNSSSSEYNAVFFMIERFLKDNINTALPVKVMEVLPRNEKDPKPENPDNPDNPQPEQPEDEDRFTPPEPVGFIKALPLICSYQAGVAGTKQRLQPTVLPRLPYIRIQGGKNALICDPKPGDVGLAIFAQQDISRLFYENNSQDDFEQTTGRIDDPAEPEDDSVGGPDPVLPGSFRTFDLSDGIYIGGLLNEIPECWINFLEKEEGDESKTTIQVVSNKNIDFKAPEEFYVSAKQMTFEVEETFKATAKSFEVQAETITMIAENTIGFETKETTIKSSEKITIETKELSLKSEDKIEIEAAKTKIKGDVEIDGNLKGKKVEGDEIVEGSIRLGNHRHTNGNEGYPTGGPIA